jgi:hypothetical protein
MEMKCFPFKVDTAAPIDEESRIWHCVAVVTGAFFDIFLVIILPRLLIIFYDRRQLSKRINICRSSLHPKDPELLQFHQFKYGCVSTVTPYVGSSSTL